jgi:hypothetical protein
MRAREFIVEYRRDITAKNLGQRLVNRNSRDNIKLDSADKILELLEANDPTNNKQYTQWMATRYIAGDFLLEDAPVVKRYLAKFLELQRYFKQNNISTDIGRYDLGKLKETVANALKIDSKTPERDINELLPVVPGTKVLYNGPEGQFVIPLTTKGSQALQEVGDESEWCTADSRATTWFPVYSGNGILYIWIERATGDKYQFHFASGQYMDKRDYRISPEKLNELFSNPIIYKNIDWRKAEQEVLSNKRAPDYIPDILYQSESFCREIVKNPNIYDALDHVPKKFMTTELLSDALRTNPHSVRFMDPSLLTPELAEIVVEGNGNLIEYIPRNIVTEKMVERVALTAPAALEHVDPNLITEPIAVDALRSANAANRMSVTTKVWHALPDSLKEDPEFIKTMVKVNMWALRFVEWNERTEELCKLAIKYHPRALQYVPPEIQNEFSDETLIDLVGREGKLLDDIDAERITPEMSLAAVKQDGMALEHVPVEQRTFELCKIAVKQNPAALWAVPDDVRKMVRVVVNQSRD